MSESTAPAATAGYAPERSVGLQMRRIVTQLAAAIDRRMEPLGLTDAQWKPLLVLRHHETATVSELARCCAMDTGGLTRLVDRLQAKGLCRRQRSEADRRVVHVALTREGADVADRLPAVLATVQDEFLAGFSSAEEARLRALLDRLQANAAALDRS